jgi:hypothetical protein
MVIVWDGLILVYVSYTETTASPTAVQLSSNCGQTDPVLRYFALLSGKDIEAAMTALCRDYVCFVV